MNKFTYLLLICTKITCLPGFFSYLFNAENAQKHTENKIKFIHIPKTRIKQKLKHVQNHVDMSIS